MSQDLIAFLFALACTSPLIIVMIVSWINETRREKEELEKMWKSSRSRRYTFRLVTERGEKEIEI